MVDYFKGTFGDTYDLDDLTIYDKQDIELSVGELSRKIWLKMGEALYYMNYLNPDMCCKQQRRRIDKMMKYFAAEKGSHTENTGENILWHLKLLFKFEDEVENFC